MLRVLVFASFVSVLMAAERPVANYDEAKVAAYTLPDPLLASDGSRIESADAWRTKRRTELLDVFAREVYGRTPAKTPQWQATVTSVDPAALGGKAVRKEITVRFGEKDDAPAMHMLIYFPAADANRRGPWPAFLGLNYYGNQSVHADPGIAISSAWMRPSAEFKIVNNRATEGTRGVHASRWDVEAVIARGYATATIYHGDLCEDRATGLTRSVGALFGTNSVEKRTGDEWGAIGIWAWGLSRAMDYLATDPDIDAARVAVHGHSRLGKAALWAAAQDERFALAISNDSGCGGAKLSRRNYGQTVEDITIAFPFWFSRNFAGYGKRIEALPVDQHALLALIAPRPLYVASAVEDRWADPRGEFLALKAAEPVYALFGRQGLGRTGMPPIDTPVHGDALAYHIRSGKHDITPYDWAQYLDFADRCLKQK